MFACLELSFKIIYKTASCCMFLFLLKNLYPYPRIGVFLEIAYPCIRYVSYPIHVPVSVHPRSPRCAWTHQQYTERLSSSAHRKAQSFISK